MFLRTKLRFIFGRFGREAQRVNFPRLIYFPNFNFSTSSNTYNPLATFHSLQTCSFILTSSRKYDNISFCLKLFLHSQQMDNLLLRMLLVCSIWLHQKVIILYYFLFFLSLYSSLSLQLKYITYNAITVSYFKKYQNNKRTKQYWIMASNQFYKIYLCSGFK